MLLISSTIFAQSNINWQGRWKLQVSEQSFCNVHIVTNLIEGQTQPTAVLEGLIDEQPFRLKATVKIIPQRNSIALYELVEEGQAPVYGDGSTVASRPLLILTQQNNGKVILPVWGLLDITTNERQKSCVVDLIPSPRLRGTYTVEQGGVATNLSLSKATKNSFKVSLTRPDEQLDCACDLQTTHLAICYFNNDKGVFYLDFDRNGVKLVQDYNDNIYQTTTKEGRNLVSNTIFNK